MPNGTTHLHERIVHKKYCQLEEKGLEVTWYWISAWFYELLQCKGPGGFTYKDDVGRWCFVGPETISRSFISSCGLPPRQKIFAKHSPWRCSLLVSQMPTCDGYTWYYFTRMSFFLTLHESPFVTLNNLQVIPEHRTMKCVQELETPTKNPNTQQIPLLDW